MFQQKTYISSQKNELMYDYTHIFTLPANTHTLLENKT